MAPVPRRPQRVAGALAGIGSGNAPPQEVERLRRVAVRAGRLWEGRTQTLTLPHRHARPSGRSGRTSEAHDLLQALAQRPDLRQQAGNTPRSLHRESVSRSRAEGVEECSKRWQLQLYVMPGGFVMYSYTLHYGQVTLASLQFWLQRILVGFCAVTSVVGDGSISQKQPATLTVYGPARRRPAPPLCL